MPSSQPGTSATRDCSISDPWPLVRSTLCPTSVPSTSWISSSPTDPGRQGVQGGLQVLLPQTRLVQKYTDTARTPTPSTSTSAPTRPIHGVECKSYPVPKNKNSLLVADMSSNYCSKPVDDSSFGLIYAGAQKNIGPSGVTIVIVRNNLLGSAQPSMPTDHPLDYKMPTPPRPCLPPPSCQGRPRFHKRSLAASHLCCCRRADSAGTASTAGFSLLVRQRLVDGTSGDFCMC
ncbi:putative phosphoserine aminotransferase 1, chloroplastic [Iris pallida]|uniref:Phosphoserine aminotransferase 1, chloroplastic n=1 Tax=Iris pallida TaxID=29817 RepID=A0AAX6H4S1_IRIPA|nr:putative phosphoserine aminotransferase 1, chloroplastic [Iris pallida]